MKNYTPRQHNDKDWWAELCAKHETKNYWQKKKKVAKKKKSVKKKK